MAEKKQYIPKLVGCATCLPMLNNTNHTRDLQKLQDVLIKIAERYFGKRDLNFTIKLPAYGNGPRIRLSNVEKWVYAELSLNAAQYWPTAVFELAHEIIHFLNPIEGCTNYLEEGIAVEFQEFIAPQFSREKIPVTLPLYLEAQRLVHKLHKEPFKAAKQIRASYGSLSSVSHNDLICLFPNKDADLLHKLVQKCKPR
jgi:hypothetical protein